MNEGNPGAAWAESTPSATPYHDRSTGLLVFGILTILLGCLAGLSVLLILVGQAVSAASPNGPTSFWTIVPAISVYVVLAVVLVWLGVGSIMARRWARALLLIFSWSWLVMGLLDVAVMAFIMPKIMANLPSTLPPGQPALPPAALDAVMFTMFLVLGVVFVIMPAIWTYFYNSRHVKATCDARDPVARWTDAIPLPVLALCLWMGLCVPMMLIMSLTGHTVMPFFGMFLTGVPASLFCLTLAAIWGVAAWLSYRLDVRGWWLILVALGVSMVSTLLTFTQHDMMEMYRLMDYPEAQLEQIQKSGLLAGNSMTWLMAFSMLPFLGYLFFVKSYFRRKP